MLTIDVDNLLTVLEVALRANASVSTHGTYTCVLHTFVIMCRDMVCALDPLDPPPPSPLSLQSYSPLSVASHYVKT